MPPTQKTPRWEAVDIIAARKRGVHCLMTAIPLTKDRKDNLWFRQSRQMASGPPPPSARCLYCPPLRCHYPTWEIERSKFRRDRYCTQNEFTAATDTATL